MGGLAATGALGRISPPSTAMLTSQARRHPMVRFADAEVIAAARAANAPVPNLIFELDTRLGEQAYRIDLVDTDNLRVVGADAAGLMYGGLDLAEALHLEEPG